MQVNVVDFAKDRVILNVTGTTAEELENKISLFFSSEGYKLKSHEGETYTYTKGNRTLRILFGAFAKFHKQSVIVKHEGDLYSVMLHKDSTGMSGGLIGMNQVKREFERISEGFKSYLKG